LINVKIPFPVCTISNFLKQRKLEHWTKLTTCVEGVSYVSICYIFNPFGFLF
jgi:hypothetical protein